MAITFSDRARETTSTVGTGTLTLTGPVSGYQAISTIGNGNSSYYTIVSNFDWEVGIGTYLSAGNQFTRDTLLSSSNGGNKINVAAGSEVFITYPAQRAILAEYAVTFSQLNLMGL